MYMYEEETFRVSKYKKIPSPPPPTVWIFNFLFHKKYVLYIIEIFARTLAYYDSLASKISYDLMK